MRLFSFFHKKLTCIAVGGWLLHSLIFFTSQYLPLRWSVCTPLDEIIPFCDWFVIPYCLWFFFFAGTAVFFLHIAVKSPVFEREAAQYIFFVFSGCAASLVCFLLVPNGVPFRPAIEELDLSRPLSRIAALLFTVDHARNVFPSLHCLIQLVCSAALLRSTYFSRKQKTALWIVLPVFTVAVFLSTVFIRQHSVLDILGAVLFGAVLYILTYKVPWKWSRERA